MTTTLAGGFVQPAKLWLTAGLLLLSGCGGPPPVGDGDGDLAAPAPSSPMAESRVDTSVPAASPGNAGSTSSPAEAVHEATEATVATSPSLPLKTALEATDPARVALGSGTPYLVEFFAFW